MTESEQLFHKIADELPDAKEGWEAMCSFHLSTQKSEKNLQKNLWVV